MTFGINNLQIFYAHDPSASHPGHTTFAMSYTITLWCGCRVYVSCHPVTRAAHTRIIERRGADCQDRHHEVTSHRPLHYGYPFLKPSLE